MRERPIIYDAQSWARVLMDYQRALFERLIAVYPELMQTRKSDVIMWRLRLSKAATLGTS